MCAVPPCSYCKNLDFAQQQSAPFTPGQYVDYDCVLPLGSLLWILFAEVRARPLYLGLRVCRQVTLCAAAGQPPVDPGCRGTCSHAALECTRLKLSIVKDPSAYGLHASLACALLNLCSIGNGATRSVPCFSMAHHDVSCASWALRSPFCLC